MSMFSTRLQIRVPTISPLRTTELWAAGVTSLPRGVECAEVSVMPSLIVASC